MRPNQNAARDDLERLLSESWQTPPDTLGAILLEIPNQVAHQNKSKGDYFTFFLNLLMVVWGGATVYLFMGLWLPISKGLAAIVGQSNFSWGSWFTDPYTGAVSIIVLGFILWFVTYELGNSDSPQALITQQ